MRIVVPVVVAVSLLAKVAFATPVPFTDTTPGAAIFTAPVAGVYEITAIGAEGGSSPGYNQPGGSGAAVTGDFNLAANEILSLLVGGVGGTGAGGGGGGGTFVAFGSTPLLVAGGGGGGSGFGPGGNAIIPSGSGDGGAAGSSGGGGGGGFLTDGAGSSFAGGGASFLNGGAGVGGGGCCGANGGVGGGGGSDNYSGGGGGYTGGNGVPGSGPYGGSSFDAGLADANFSEQILTSSVNNGNGELTISLVTAPEPASMALLGVGLAGLIGLRRRRRT